MEDQKILVVDADSKNLQILKNAFEAAGFQIGTAMDGEQAWEQINASPPHLVLSEVNLPNCDGFQLLQRLKENSSTSHIPIVFLTNRREIQDRVRSLRGGVKDYMIKPVHVKEVIARIRMIFRRLERVRHEEVDSANKIVGRLEDTSVVELIEKFGVERRSGTLSIYNENNKNGEIHLRGGAIVFASLGPLKSEKAIYQMLPWKSGHFIMTYKEINTADSISVSNLGLLLQGFKRLEQRERLIKKLPSLETTFVISPTFQRIINQKNLASDVSKFINLIDGKRDIQRIIDESIYDDIKTLERLVKLSEQGFIVPGTAKQDETPQIKVSGTLESDSTVSGPIPAYGFEAGSKPSSPPHIPLQFETHEENDTLEDEQPSNNQHKEPESPTTDQIQSRDKETQTAEFEEFAPQAPSRSFDLTDDTLSALEAFEDDIDNEDADDPSFGPPQVKDDSSDSMTPMPTSLPDFSPDLDLFESLQEIIGKKNFHENGEKVSAKKRDAEETQTPPKTEKPVAQPEEPRIDKQEISDKKTSKREQSPVSFSFPKRTYGFVPKRKKKAEKEEPPVEQELNRESAKPETPQKTDSPLRFNLDDALVNELASNKDEILQGEDSLFASTPSTLGNKQTPPLSILPTEHTDEIKESHQGVIDALLGYTPFAKRRPGTFVFIGSTQQVADDLLKRICPSEAIQSSEQHGISIANLQLRGNYPFKLLSVSIDHQFTKLLSGIQDNLSGFVILFESGNKNKISYLNYLYSSLKNKYKLPTGIAIIKSKGKKPLAASTVRDLINGDNSDFITNLNSTQAENTASFLSDMLHHFSTQKDRAKHETE